MGYDYGLVSQLARDKGLVLDLQVAPSMAAMVEMLDSGLVDLLAYEVPVTAEYRQKAIACGPETLTSQVLVQMRSDTAITDVTQLVGRDIYVEKDSKYHYRLLNLNDELGGGVRIHPIDRDTLITEDLIDMVQRGEIPLTVVDSDIAALNKTYYPGMDITVPLSFAQRNAWAVSPTRPWLADSVNAWLGGDAPRREMARLHRRYFELSRGLEPPSEGIPTLNLSSGRISPYDQLFRHHAEALGWDWRLLAAVGYAESRFHPTIESWAGAKGLMQIMPRTARAYGIGPDRILNPDDNIYVASRILQSLNASLKGRVPAPDERRKFILAAYNSGLAHILDAITLARLNGLDPTVWDGNVERALLLKAQPEHYNHPEVKYGYFRGRETVGFVKTVLNNYHTFTQHIPR